MSDVCTRCLRPRASTPEQQMSIKFCREGTTHENIGDVTCDLMHEKNVLVAALRSVLKSHDKATIRTAAVLLEEIVGASKDCPLCGHVGAVFKGYVKIHYAHVTADRPCKAAFKNCVGGILL